MCRPLLLPDPTGGIRTTPTGFWEHHSDWASVNPQWHDQDGTSDQQQVWHYRRNQATTQEQEEQYRHQQALDQQQHQQVLDEQQRQQEDWQGHGDNNGQQSSR